MFAKRREDIANIEVLLDGGVHLSIDLPPSPSNFLSPDQWDANTKQKFVEWEVRRLQARMPPGVLSMELASMPRGVSRSESSDSPWVVSAIINGPEGSAYCVPGGMKLQVLLPTEYPAKPPEINIMQACRLDRTMSTHAVWGPPSGVRVCGLCWWYRHGSEVVLR